MSRWTIAAVCIALPAFSALAASQAPPAKPKSLVQFFRESPLVGLDLDLERDKDTGRDTTL